MPSRPQHYALCIHSHQSAQVSHHSLYFKIPKHIFMRFSIQEYLINHQLFGNHNILITGTFTYRININLKRLKLNQYSIPQGCLARYYNEIVILIFSIDTCYNFDTYLDRNCLTYSLFWLYHYAKFIPSCISKESDFGFVSLIIRNEFLFHFQEIQEFCNFISKQ